jgi:DNA-binding GntR family transcriptional regulator
VRTLSREELREAFLVRAELESLATELATPKMSDEDLALLDSAAERFAELTDRLLRRVHAHTEDRSIVADWVRANHGFHDVIYAAAQAPLVEQLAKDERRTFLSQGIWAAGSWLDDLYELNLAQHRAIRHAIAARNPQGARALAREHVLHSGRLLEAILDQVEERQRVRTRRRRAS